jgi:hypothetical protein
MANPLTPAQDKLKKLKQNEGWAMAGAWFRGFFFNPENKTLQTTWRGVAFRQVRSSLRPQNTGSLRPEQLGWFRFRQGH